MLLLEVEALENGAHRNQRSETPFTVIPEGMLPVAEELEEEAWGYLPFINITEITDGVIYRRGAGHHPAPGTRAGIAANGHGGLERFTGGDGR